MIKKKDVIFGKKNEGMMCQGWIALYYLVDGGLEEPTVPYGNEWEEKESAELLRIVSSATKEMRRRGLSLSAPPKTVRITRSCRIFIGTKEIRIRPMAKSVLLLFLKHPEGIALKRLSEYQGELAAFYRKLSRSSEPAEIESRLSRMLDLFNNEINVNIARVNKAVAALVDEASCYRIEGEAGHPKRISLDRKCVIWE